jgi:hypothetical protein
MPTNRTTATSQPPGMTTLMLDGQNTEGRTNHAKKESGPLHGEISPLPDGGSARSKAVSHTIASVR